jgi:hypothetical protein
MMIAEMEAVVANFKEMLRNAPGGTTPTIQSQCSIDIRDHPLVPATVSQGREPWPHMRKKTVTDEFQSKSPRGD